MPKPWPRPPPPNWKPQDELMRESLRRRITNLRLPEQKRAELILELAKFGPCALTDLEEMSWAESFDFRRLSVGLQFYARQCVKWLRERYENPRSRKPPPKPVAYRMLGPR